jgi:catechol 2,3-dioxygenase
MSDVLRMGYVHARVTDLARAKDHYANTLGLYPTLEEDGKLYFKGWDEWDHHSVVLEEGGVGAVKFGFKVWGADALDGIERRAQLFGDCTVTRMSAGDNREVSDGVRVHLPCIDHTFEFYHSMTEVGLEVGTHNPDAFPRHLVGVGAPMLDHALLIGEDIDTAARFFAEVVDFYTTERAQTDLSDEHQTIAYWLSASQKVHDIALLRGENGKLHHFAFQMRDWNDILHAADLFSMDDVPIDVGPTRHGITRGETIYFFDPAGNRNETFAGGYTSYRDRPTIIWTADQLAKGIFYHARELKESFTAVYT